MYSLIPLDWRDFSNYDGKIKVSEINSMINHLRMQGVDDSDIRNWLDGSGIMKVAVGDLRRINRPNLSHQPTAVGQAILNSNPYSVPNNYSNIASPSQIPQSKIPLPNGVEMDSAEWHKLTIEQKNELIDELKKLEESNEAAENVATALRQQQLKDIKRTRSERFYYAAVQYDLKAKY